MGDFAKSLSERSKHTKITTGHCLICGTYGTLSQDHVPPQGSITVTAVEQVHLTEAFDLQLPKVKGVRSPNGSKFRTICRNCNMTALGQNDGEIAEACKSFTRKINHFFKYANSPVSSVHTPVNALKYARAMVGHVLSATSVQECVKPGQSTPYFDPLKKFVLGDDHAMSDTHDIFYWFFPHKYHQSIKLFSVKNGQNICCMSLLSFFPLAFLVTEKEKGIYPVGAVKLELTDKSLFLDLSGRNVQFSSFPAVELQGDQMVALTAQMSIVSYPIR
ncbi:metal-binding protein [Pseudomonas sp. DWRC2-2]|uniref:metal-binding protein n=1 Tax=Pseudomonas sp. DWRC2-2 TaxID=2804567 RepID=UPI003CE67E77